MAKAQVQQSCTVKSGKSVVESEGGGTVEGAQVEQSAIEGAAQEMVVGEAKSTGTNACVTETVLMADV